MGNILYKNSEVKKEIKKNIQNYVQKTLKIYKKCDYKYEFIKNKIIELNLDPMFKYNDFTVWYRLSIKGHYEDLKLAFKEFNIDPMYNIWMKHMN